MNSWASILFRLGLLFATGIAVGALYGEPLAGLLVVVIATLGWHLLWLYRLDRWLRGEKIDYLPEGSGVWARTFARIDFLRRRGKRRGKRFKALLKQLRQATGSFPDAGVILNSNNEIVIFNRAAKGMLGFKKKDRGLRIDNLIRDPGFVAYLHGGNPSVPVEIISPLHNERWLSCNVVPYGLKQKMLLIRDVTEQRKTEDMRRDFVANASHELRTPLTVVAGYLEALSDDAELGEYLRQPVREMSAQTDRMRQLVEELLRLSELEAEPVVVDPETVSICPLLETSRQEALIMPGCPKQLKIYCDSDADLRGNVRDIQSVVSNLISNAVRYTPEDGQIDVRWWTDKKGGYISVSDSGCGIAREHLPRLSERFYRVEDGRERIGGMGGTGLGLAIVKHALARHGAELKIESEQGRGSVFTAYFPADCVVPAA